MSTPTLAAPSSTTTLTPLDALAIEVIHNLSLGALSKLPTYARVTAWQVGLTDDGVPLVSGQLPDMDPDDTQSLLVLLADNWPLRQLLVDDPERIALTWAWPEPLRFTPIEDRPEQVAIVEIWAPAAPLRMPNLTRRWSRWLR